MFGVVQGLRLLENFSRVGPGDYHHPIFIRRDNIARRYANPGAGHRNVHSNEAVMVDRRRRDHTAAENGELKFAESDCRARAAEFTKERFHRELIESIREAWGARGKDLAVLNDRLKMSWSETAREMAL